MPKAKTKSIFFNVYDLQIIDSENFLVDIINLCFQNSEDWDEVDVSKMVVTTVGSAQRAVDTNLAEFENWLISKYGSEFTDQWLGSTIRNGVEMDRYQAMLHNVSKDRTYLITSTISVEGFVTSVLGLILSPGLLALFGAITSGLGLLSAGDSVHKYTVQTNWFRYVTINEGTYPYCMTDKFITYNGYAVNSCMVDAESAVTLFSPSEAYYNNNSLQYNDAYAEYQRIGWQG